MAWRITWDDRSWTEDDLTIGQVMAIIQAQGVDSWEQIDPFGGPARLVGILAVLIASETGEPIEDVIRAIALRKAPDLINALGSADVDDPNLISTLVADVQE